MPVAWAVSACLVLATSFFFMQQGIPQFYRNDGFFINILRSRGWLFLKPWLQAYMLNCILPYVCTQHKNCDLVPFVKDVTLWAVMQRREPFCGCGQFWLECENLFKLLFCRQDFVCGHVNQLRSFMKSLRNLHVSIVMCYLFSAEPCCCANTLNFADSWFENQSVHVMYPSFCQKLFLVESFIENKP